MPFAAVRRNFSASIALILLSLAALPSFSLRADTLVLSNGDRLTGQLVKQADDKIQFLSPVLGMITVSTADAKVELEPETPVESLTGLPPQPSKPKAALAATPAKAGSAASTAAAPPPASPPWKGQVEVGYQQLSGQRNSLNTSVRASLEKTSGPDNFKLSGSYLYGESEGSPSIDRTNANFRWRRDLSPRTFVQTLSTYYNDKIKQINFDAEQNLGIGFKLLNGDRQTANVGGGLTAQYRNAVGVQPGMNYLGEFFQDYSYKLNGRLSLLEDGGALYSPVTRGITNPLFSTSANATRQATNYKYHFGATLQGKMSERISLNLRYEYEYDNVILDREARGDHRITSSIAYGF